MIQQFVLDSDLQQLISGFQSKATANVEFNIDFGNEIPPALPTNPNTVRRSLMFSKLDTSPTEYNCYIQNMDGSDEVAMSVPRGL